MYKGRCLDRRERTRRSDERRLERLFPSPLGLALMPPGSLSVRELPLFST